MSRPDWGALQQEYIAEYTRSGISPVAWCEARGLNYATARRYIKKTPKNAQTEMCKTAQKSAQKKSAQTAQKRNEKSQEKKPVFDAGLNEGDAEEFSFCPDEFGISDQQAKFAMLVAQGKKPTEAYRLAASINIKPGHDYYFYIRSVNTVGKSAFVEAVGHSSICRCTRAYCRYWCSYALRCDWFTWTHHHR